MNITRRASSGSRRWSSRKNPGPSSSGIRMSMRMRSNGAAPTSSSAVRPLVAVDTRYPSAFRMSSTTLAKTGSSSTTRMDRASGLADGAGPAIATGTTASRSYRVASAGAARSEDPRLEAARHPGGHEPRRAGDALERLGVAGPVLQHEPSVHDVEDPVHEDRRDEHVVERAEDRDEVRDQVHRRHEVEHGGRDRDLAAVGSTGSVASRATVRAMSGSARNSVRIR